MRIPLLALFSLILISCGKEVDTDLCDRYLEPYPDLISDRKAAEPRDQIYISAMQLYSAGEYAQAAESLQAYLNVRGYQKSAHLYLAICLLEMDLPFEAELQLDHLENSNVKDFSDQTHWYTMISWVCSGQFDRALPEARRIATLQRHTYKKEAAQLLKELERSNA